MLHSVQKFDSLCLPFHRQQLTIQRAPWKTYNQSIVHNSTFLVSESTMKQPKHEMIGREGIESCSEITSQWTRVGRLGREFGTCQQVGFKSRGAGSPARFASALSFFRPLASPQRLLAAMSESRLRPYHAVHHQSPAVIRSIEGRISGEACVGRRLVTRGS
jgi:hypothetical protein